VDELLRSTIAAPPLVAVFTTLAAKHVIADYVLQSSWMARGKQRTRGWLAPLAAHAGCHGILTTAIALSAAPRLWWLGVVDFLAHSTIDRCKSAAAAAYRWTPEHRLFWWSIGIDQSLHHLTGFFIAIMLVAGR
jgi:hypothetical protein